MQERKEERCKNMNCWTNSNCTFCSGQLDGPAGQSTVGLLPTAGQLQLQLHSGLSWFIDCPSCAAGHTSLCTANMVGVYWTAEQL